ncbi:protoheme IX farnesyltransferase [Exophiala mesophila]|uniref:Protoheme IX farnesyltransferase, mitochondrial n=1 Tax=Exophiala mesophila TaxID=212818 RepID=A0A0D1WXQ2_EXOME|nr:protoheme IX farnesyltransferase [Exophiala mesophila]KIV94210.1 protoheme IX farnesyltransferase [Exophiala mesophila]
MAAPAGPRLLLPCFACCPATSPSINALSLVRRLGSSPHRWARTLHERAHQPARSARDPSKALFHSRAFIPDYFSANSSIERGWITNGLLASMRTVSESPARSSQASHTLNSVQRSAENDPHHSLRRSHTLDRTPPPPPPPPTLVQDDSQGQLSSQGASVADIDEAAENLLPHRRRQRRKSQQQTSSSDGSDKPSTPSDSLPLDASSQLTSAAAALPASASFRRRATTYLSLSKPRLSFLILLTTTSAYSLYPIPDILSATTSAVESSFSTSTMTLVFLTSGTFLSCACANTLNMLFEPKYDALMTRTRNRPLVRNLISPRGAALFALLCGTSGLLLLGFGTNPTVAGLSALNIFLYAGVYTPMKRISPANTWVGAIVGGIPPLMGWCAAAGQTATSEHHSWQDLLLSEDAAGGWALAALLFAWQFPHFMSLSHTIKDDYRNAGHKMLAWTNPARNARVALRYSVAMFPICGFLYWSGYVNPGFLAISTVFNVWMTREAVRFWRKQGAGGSARGLFWASVWQLPLVLIGALVCKRGIWDGFFGAKDVHSIYDEDQDIEDGPSLGMHSTHAEQRQQPPGEINMAMMGFKRPT